ncbi:hypothetical protein TNIN_75521, partial [Trichonephila inaurata madagascariensis]
QQMAPLAKGNPAIKTPTQASRVFAPPPQPVNANTNPNLERPFYLLNSGTANRDLTHSVTTANHIAPYPHQVSAHLTQFRSQTPRHLLSPPPLRLLRLPASQSGNF